MEHIAIVTGGGTGIGRACAERLSKSRKAIAVGLDRDEHLSESVEFVQLDVTDEAEVARFVGRHKSVSALVNCAGIILPENREFTAEGFRKVVDVNLVSAHIITMGLRTALAACGGSVVNIASMWSFFGSGRNPAYASSKGGVVQLTRSHAVALASDGIRVNAVAPGWIDTRLAAGAKNDAERNAAIMLRLPLKRWGTPEEVADVVAFLLSEDARYVTGAVLPVDGGYGIA